MARCTDTTPWHGETLQCEADEDDHTRDPQDGGDPRHYATITIPDGTIDAAGNDHSGKQIVTRWFVPEETP